MICQAHPQTRQIEAILVELNSNLIWSVVNRYPRELMPSGDLFSEGVAGFLKAVRRFDPTRNFKLTTFAVHWIRQSVGRALEEYKLIRVPSHAQEGSVHVRRAQDALGSGATAEEIALHAGLPLTKVKSILRGMAVGHFLSLDAPLIEDGAPLESILVEHATPSAEAEALEHLESLDLHSLLHRLPEREQEVMQLRFVDLMTLSETGARLGISRERARQLEVQALRFLRKCLTRESLMTTGERLSASAAVRRPK